LNSSVGSYYDNKHKNYEPLTRDTIFATNVETREYELYNRTKDPGRVRKAQSETSLRHVDRREALIHGLDPLVLTLKDCKGTSWRDP
jgi:hypothetical protein